MGEITDKERQVPVFIWLAFDLRGARTGLCNCYGMCSHLVICPTCFPFLVAGPKLVKLSKQVLHQQARRANIPQRVQ